jgi:hypothetical protein
MFTRAVAKTCLPLLALVNSQPQDEAGMRSAQSRILARLVHRLARLPVGRHFGLEKLPTDHRLPAAFDQMMQVTTYGDYSGLIARVAWGERDVLFSGRAQALAQTSGTTSTGKAGERYIPQNADLLRHHARGGAVALVRLLESTGSRLLDGQMLMLGGSTALQPNPRGIPVGDLSGIMAARIPRWLRGAYEPGLAIALEADWERKLDRIAERCGAGDVRMVSGIPSWMLMLFTRICSIRGVSRVRTAWTKLGGFIHGGHAIGPFLASLREHLAPETWMLEVYPASEAFIGIGSRAWRLGDGSPPELELLSDCGVLLEFAPEDGGAIRGPWAIEPDRLYRVLVTTPSGLIRYQLGDVVLGVRPGQVRFAGRIAARISVFGEHVEGVHLDGALTAACSATAAEVAHYHVAPVLPSGASLSGRHEWWVEFIRQPAHLGTFCDTIDQHLRQRVLDYDAHRAGHQLLGPQLVVTPPGTFRRYLAAAGKLGGQHKVPQAWNDRSIAEALDRSAGWEA